jgi:uncharacterized protein
MDSALSSLPGDGHDAATGRTRRRRHHAGYRTPAAAVPAPASGLHLDGERPQTLVKLLIAGPFGVGKSTFIRSLSETEPMLTEEVVSSGAAVTDDLSGVRERSTTTVAIDFGRLSLPGDLVLYMFGTPGRSCFAPLWQDISQDALGALVLADTRRLSDSFEAMDMIEDAGLRYAVAVNSFPDSPVHHAAEIRDHLDLLPDTPLVQCDVRDPEQATDALIGLMGHVLALTPQEAV